MYCIENEYPPIFEEFSQIWGQHKPSAWEAIMLANVAHSISELADLRPRALYLCCQLEFEEILDGALRPDGRRECLSASDIKRCIVGRERLAHANCAAVGAVLAAADLVCSCQRPGVCGFRVAAIALERHTMRTTACVGCAYNR
ncbi:hypothetical protein A0H81_04996 [Grifola frondosa]|uniref:Uncharacterized protein n=1 Tax=Grifola frondosa TaxID=5627 RepID=A0A1C7MG21_GRIFR|nr:hypothetical protein A0H81_04996 [Grifola frondosa]